MTTTWKTTKTKKQRAHKELYVDGKQQTLLDLKVYCANMCWELKAMFDSTEQLILYETIHRLLLVLHSSKAQTWLDGEIDDNPYYLHSIFACCKAL